MSNVKKDFNNNNNNNNNNNKNNNNNNNNNFKRFFSKCEPLPRKFLRKNFIVCAEP